MNEIDFNLKRSAIWQIPLRKQSSEFRLRLSAGYLSETESSASIHEQTLGEFQPE